MKNPLSALVVSLIDVYRRYLSHRKGYRCAHHRFRGEGSCSHYGRRAFAEHGFLTAARLTRQRLRECSLVYEAHVSRMSRTEYEAHWHTRGFMLSPHHAWIERWRQRKAV